MIFASQFDVSFLQGNKLHPLGFIIRSNSRAIMYKIEPKLAFNWDFTWILNIGGPPCNTRKQVASAVRRYTGSAYIRLMKL